jgi:hypothetical protein
MVEMIAEADQWVIARAAKHTGAPVELIPRLIGTETTAAMLQIYSRNWAAVQAHADDRFKALPWVESGTFGEPRTRFSLEEFPGAEAQVLKHEDGLLTLRFFDPVAFAMATHASTTAVLMPPKDVGLSAASGGFISRNVFRTELDGAPAIGISQGFWTVITTYSRSEHGLFVPSKMAIFDRRKEG